jgi:Spy/CpxP family protein refolding chaperone
MKKHMFTLSLIIALLLAANAFARGGPGQGPGKGGGMMQMLDLSEEQQSQMEELRLAHHKEMLPLQAQLETLETNLKLEMTAEKFDEGKAKKIVAEMEALRTEMHIKRLLHQQQVRNMLTAEQRQTFDLHLLSERGPGGGHGDRPPHAPRNQRMQQECMQQ